MKTGVSRLWILRCSQGSRHTTQKPFHQELQETDDGFVMVDLPIGSGKAATEPAERQRECVTPDFGLDGSFWEQH